MSTHVIIEADGGSRGSPGPAGFGAVVVDARSGEVLVEAKDAIGFGTNNADEYRGLIAGLEAARVLGAQRVEVRMYSQPVVQQMDGTWSGTAPSRCSRPRRSSYSATSPSADGSASA